MKTHNSNSIVLKFVRQRKFALSIVVTAVCCLGPVGVNADRPCQPYRPKRDGVVVYQEDSVASKVVATVSLGQRVCYLGERGEFSLVELQQGEGEQTAVYIRSVDLWPPDRPQTITEQLTGYFRHWRSGARPDDSTWLFRPLLGCGAEPKCRAGKICDQIESKATEESSR